MRKISSVVDEITVKSAKFNQNSNLLCQFDFGWKTSVVKEQMQPSIAQIFMIVYWKRDE